MPENTPMTPEQAYDTLVTNVHAPVFFEKLARVYGIRPHNEDDARELLLIAGELRHAHEQDRTKQAAAASSVLQNARHDLQGVLREQGYQTLRSDDLHGPTIAEPQVKEAAARAAQHPLLREASLVLQNHLAQAMAR